LPVFIQCQRIQCESKNPDFLTFFSKMVGNF